MNFLMELRARSLCLQSGRHSALAALGLVVLAAGASAQRGAPAHDSAVDWLDPARTAAPEAAVLDRVPEGLLASDWASIRAAREADRHAAFAVVHGYAARNPGQDWTTHFDGCGFLTRHEAAGWTWGLELERYGFEGAEREVSQSLCGSAQGQRVTYVRDENLEEWWINDARGLEHGYTLRDRPEAGERSDLLTLMLAVRGDLVPSVQEDGRGISFAKGDGASVLTYAGLVVFDADGTPLPAWFELGESGLVLKIDERGARYPLTIDPVAQQTYLKASNASMWYEFGQSVSVSGNTVVVGSISECSSATGVNGNQADSSAVRSGAAYVFVRNGTSWSQQAYLKASNTDAQDLFGSSVSLSGDTIVVGAVNESSSASGVNGNQFDNNLLRSGAAYVFVRNGTSWSQQAYLKAANPDVEDKFGYAVSVSGNTIVISARFEDSDATGVNGNGADDSAIDAGAAYVFVRNGTTWIQQAYLKASNTDPYDNFGVSVSLSADTLVVGAGGEDSSATGVNGNQADDSLESAGAAYVFARSGTAWSQQAYLKASNSANLDVFGASVSVSGDTLAIGAFGEDSSATGVDGNGLDDSADFAGAAYVFVRNGTSWSQQAYLKASNTEPLDLFGYSLSVSGDTVAVSAQREGSNATGINGDQTNNSAAGAGAAYVFLRHGTTWRQQAYLKASNPEQADYFGWTLSLSGGTFVVGAPGESSNATGVGGNQADNSAPQAGAAYEFILSIAYCFGDGVATGCPCGNTSPAGAGEGCLNSLGLGARLGSSGIPSLSSDSLVLQGVQMPNSSALYFQGTAQQNGGLGVLFGDGLRCVGGSIVRLGTKFNAGNASQYPAVGDLSISARTAAQGGPIGAGTTRHYQVWYRNAAVFCTSSTYNLTNGLSVTWSS